jgi:hypothetical protein
VEIGDYLAFEKQDLNTGQIIAAVGDVGTLSLKELKQALTARGIGYSTFKEKSEFRSALKGALLEERASLLPLLMAASDSISASEPELASIDDREEWLATCGLSDSGVFSELHRKVQVVLAATIHHLGFN